MIISPTSATWWRARAYAQLGYSPLMLAGTLLGLFLVYIAPVVAALFGWGMSQIAGWLAWVDHGADVPAHPALLSPVAALGPGAAADRRLLCRLHPGFRHPALVGQGRHVEGPRPGAKAR